MFLQQWNKKKKNVLRSKNILKKRKKKKCAIEHELRIEHEDIICHNLCIVKSYSTLLLKFCCFSVSAFLSINYKLLTSTFSGLSFSFFSVLHAGIDVTCCMVWSTESESADCTSNCASCDFDLAMVETDVPQYWIPLMCHYWWRIHWWI